MKKIIVAMDFSKGANNALNYAIDIALSTNSEILLLWVDTRIDGSFIPGGKNEERQDAKLELKSIISAKTEEHQGLEISYKLRKGKVYQELALQAESCNTDLIIVGTHGIGGFEEFWVGSNAFKIISYSPCPVISVRTDFSKEGNIKSIVLPIDDSFDTTKKVPMAAKLALAFNAEIQVLAIYYSELASLKKLTDTNIKETKRFLVGKGVITKYKTCLANNVSSSIVKFAENNSADLIVIMTDQDKASKDILMGINSQQIINRSSIPILSVKPDKLEF